MSIAKKNFGLPLILILAPLTSFAGESTITAFVDPPICSSFEKSSQPNEYSCAITSNGNDKKGDERKKVSIKLKAQTKIINIGGYQVETENYGTYLPPVVEARAGDTVSVDLENALGEPLVEHHHACPNASGGHSAGSNPTNLHYFHGGIVSPNNGNSPGSALLGTGDNIYSCVERAKSFRYEVPIPGALELNGEVLEALDRGTKISHPSGLNWYHSHLHGISANQVMSGMSGLLSVGKRDENLRAICASGVENCEKKNEDLRRKTLVKYALLRDISIIRSAAGNWKPDPKGQNFDVDQKCGVVTGATFDTKDVLLRRGFCQRGKVDDQSTPDEDRLWLFTINGQKFPTIDVDEDKTGLLLRLGNLSANVSYWLELYDEENPNVTKNITIVSVDGVVPARPQSQSASVSAYQVPDLLLMPASRVEIYIDRSDMVLANDKINDKTFVLRSKAFPLGSDVTGSGRPKNWPQVQLARITFKSSQKPPENIALNVAAAERAPVSFGLDRAAPSQTMTKPQGCQRDIQEGEYRQVQFALNFDSASLSWKIITSIMKNGNPQPDLVIATPFHKYVDPATHEIKWNETHTCIELKHGMESKPQLWELFNDTSELHNFHIHQMKFRLATATEIETLGIKLPKMSSTCQGQAKCATPDYKLYNDENPSGGSVSKLGKAISQKGEKISSILEWQDTIPVPEGSRVYVMMSFADKVQVGRFVYHCHILGHEDNGLMAPIEVWDPSAPAAGITQ